MKNDSHSPGGKKNFTLQKTERGVNGEQADTLRGSSLTVSKGRWARYWIEEAGQAAAEHRTQEWGRGSWAGQEVRKSDEDLEMVWGGGLGPQAAGKSPSARLSPCGHHL